MRSRVSITFLALLGALFLLLPAAQADVLATLTFQGVVGNLYDRGVGIDPYIIDVQPDGGLVTSMYLLCDDWIDHVWGGASWQARVIQGSETDALGTTRMATLATQDQGSVDMVRLYNEKAYLELQMGSGNQSRIDTSYALWYIFMPNTVGWNRLTSGAQTLVSQAEAAIVGDPHSLYRDRLTIYTPVGPYDTEGHYYQEFNNVNVPDGGVTLMLLGGALVGLETLRRRFRA